MELLKLEKRDLLELKVWNVLELNQRLSKQWLKLNLLKLSEKPSS
jgi:hypothetical protein